MKKVLGFLLLFALMPFLGCKSDGAEVKIVADTVEDVAPLTVNFDISTSEAVSLSEFYGYQMRIVDEENSEFSKNLEGMQFSHTFTKVGKYQVEVSISDTYGGVGSGTVEINVLSPFTGKSWSPAISAFYENQVLSLSASSLGMDEAQYTWKISHKDGDVVLVASDISPIFETDYDFSSGLYNIELSVVDKYGNAHTFPTKLVEILSVDSPVGVLAARYNGVDINSSSEIYEYETISLDALGSRAAHEENPSLTISKVYWSVFKDGVEVDTFVKTSVEAFDYELAEAGSYDILFQVENSIGLKSASNNVVFGARRNMPSIGSIAPDEFMEGIAGEIVLTGVESDSPVRGGIVSVVLNIDGLTPIEITDVENVFWTPGYIEESTSDKNYVGYITVVNEAGREFNSEDFVLVVKDNNPRPVLNVSKEAVMYDSSVEFDAIGSSSPDGTLDELSFELRNSSNTIVASHVFLGNPAVGYSYTFSGPGSVGTYTAIMTASNINGSRSSTKQIVVTEKTSTASFTVDPDPDNQGIYEGEKVTLDARGSYGSDGLPIPPLNYTWDVKNNGLSTGRVPVDTGVDGVFEYQFVEDDFGSFSFKLTVEDLDGKAGSLTKQFFVQINKPIDLKVQKTGASTPGNQVLVGSAVSPDGDYSNLSYRWYVEQMPGFGVVPDFTTQTATLNFVDGEDHLLYLEVVKSINGFELSSVVQYNLVADDLTPPDVPVVINSYVDSFTSSTMPIWSWTSSSDAVEYRYAVAPEGAGEPANPSTWDKTSSTQGQSSIILTAGVYTVYVQARDSADPTPNWSASGTNTVTVDLTPPDVAVMITVSGRTKERKPEWSWEAGNLADTYGYRYQLNSQSSSGWSVVLGSDPKQFSPASDLDDGVYELFVQARDKAGNWSSSVSSEWVVDNVGPDITLNGEDITVVNVYSTYTDLGATAYDVSWDRAVDVTVSGDTLVDTSVLNSDYEITYYAEDDLGNFSEAFRSVWVRDIEPPVVTLSGDASITLYMDETYIEPGVSANDNYDGAYATGDIVVNSNLDLTKAGNYSIVYSVVDSSGNPGSVTRTITVLPKAVEFTSAVEFDMLDASDSAQVSWGPLNGVFNYKILKAAHIDGPYSDFATTDQLSYVINPDFGVSFYKVVGLLGAQEGDYDDVAKFAKVYDAKVLNVSASTSDVNMYIDVNWTSFPGVDGYRVYYSTLVDDVGALSYVGESSNLSYRTDNSVDVGPLYFRVRPILDKSLYGWTGGKLEGLVYSDSAFGCRGVTNNEWVNEVMKEVYEAIKLFSWSDIPWSDYWNASGGDRDGINAGFTVDPSGVPGNIPGSKVAGPYVMIAKFVSGQTKVWSTNGGSEETANITTGLIQGRSIVEIARSKENHLDALNADDYVFTRWWFDGVSSIYLTLTGNRRYHKDWYNNNGQIYGNIDVTGLYPGNIVFNWMSTDQDYTKDGGAGTTGGNFVVTRNGSTTTVPFNSSLHFSW